MNGGRPIRKNGNFCRNDFVGGKKYSLTALIFEELIHLLRKAGVCLYAPTKTGNVSVMSCRGG